jgi:hypothetical protein
MSRTTLDYLFRVEPPWIYFGPAEPERKAWNPSHFYSCEGLSVCVRHLRGQKMRSTEALMDEFAAALQFFGEFGKNWYALEECLGYLDEWLPANAYVLVVEGAEELLQEEGLAEKVSFLKVIHATGEFWAKPIADGDRFDRPAVPFHVLLNWTSAVTVADTDIAKAARDAGIPLRH